MKWLNKTDLRITQEDVTNRVTFRQIAWQGFSGKFYPLGSEIKDEPGFSPVYVQIGDYGTDNSGGESDG